jgi:pyridoxine 5'-phosphate synthase PdxJ
MLLGVNIDHVATLRNARGGIDPDVIRAARVCNDAGADGITTHLREDRRHIKDIDVEIISKLPRTKLNLEMAMTDEMQTIALKVMPHSVCIVPDKSILAKNIASNRSATINSIIATGIAQFFSFFILSNNSFFSFKFIFFLFLISVIYDSEFLFVCQ